jgi:hypothetical protein
MPKVDADTDHGRVFEQARRQADDAKRQGNSVMIVTPGRMIIELPCSPPGSMAENVVGPIRELAPLPATTITVIGFNDIVADFPNARHDEVEKQRQLREMMNQAVPFFGYVLGFGYLGHNVMLFEGHPLAYAAGLRGAEMLMVDSIMIEALPPDWIEIARREMVGRRRVVVFRRDGGLEALELPPPDDLPPAPTRSPEQSAALLRQGLALAKADDYAGAIMRFSEALEADPDNTQLRKFRAAAYLRTKQYREALDDYEVYLDSPAGPQDPEHETIAARVEKLRGIL